MPPSDLISEPFSVLVKKLNQIIVDDSGGLKFPDVFE